MKCPACLRTEGNPPHEIRQVGPEPRFRCPCGQTWTVAFGGIVRAEDNIRWYYDGGHEWLAVPVALVKAAGIWDQVSSYSYIDHATAIMYLEGDVDAALYCRAARFDPSDCEQVDLGESAFIRNLYRFRRE